MGLFSFIGGIFGGGAQKKASQQAMQAQTDALNRATDIGNQQFQQTRQDYMPYTQAGTKAIGAYGDLVGLNDPQNMQQAIDQLKVSPLYTSLFNNGQEALLQNAAATGGIRGGNTQRGLADFGSDTLAQVYQNQISNLNNLAGLGLGATGSVSQFGAMNAQNASKNAIGIGTAQADNYLTKGRINANNWQQAGGFVDSAVSKALGSIF